MKKLIKDLVEAFGPSGSEDKIREVIRAKIAEKVDQIKVDNMGNLIALKKGESSKKSVMLAAHMDEIGFIATHIDDEGFIRFSNIGGLPTHTLLGERVIFNDKTVGVIDKEAKLDDISKLKLDKMYIDIGAKNKEEALKKVKVGDTASYYRRMDELGDRIVAKSLDDRIGVAFLIEALNKLKGQPTYDTYFVFTVQEEVGIRGAKTSAYGIEPDFGIAVDVTRTGDTPEAKRMEVSLGEGPTIKVKDSSVLVPPKVKGMMVEIAKEKGIPYQLEVLEAGGSDTSGIQLSRDGVLAGAISIPCRYIHSPSEMIDINDVQNGVELLVSILESDYKGVI
ncbi:M42 family metallopeptidase [Halonatronum saccharophilum]|uniref:M42 family metallopeptidase n=1 Tax=Halonatronum saccharophilum TaxID=150060 RepID=UPI0004891C07|nr:M42 family metallopeptidase [Halonatronum saccharophilum]